MAAQQQQHAQQPQPAILGAGAIGQLLSHALNAKSVSPRLLLRDRHSIDALLKTGLRCAGPVLNSRFTPSAVTADCAAQQPISTLIVCCKAGQTLDAITAWRHRLATDCRVVLLQNGMGLGEELQAIYPSFCIFHAVSRQAAWRESQFSVIHAAVGDTKLGSLDPHAAETSRELSALLDSPGFTCQPETAESINALLWHKLSLNALINPLALRYRCRNGELAENPQARADMLQLSEEIAQLRPPGVANWNADYLCRQGLELAVATAANYCSMLQDRQAGRSTEIEYITGYLCRQGKRRGLDMPANESLYREIVEDTAAR